MKLNEIKPPNTKYEEWREAMSFPKNAWKVTADGKVAINTRTQRAGYAYGISDRVLVNGKLPFEFESITLAVTDKDPMTGAVSFREGHFSIRSLRDLVSFEGMPRKFEGYLDIGYCEKVPTLQGLPKNVKGSIWLHSMEQLKSLKGLPNVMNGHLSISDLDFSAIDYLPNFFEGIIELKDIANFTSLTGFEDKLSVNFKGELIFEFAKIKSGGIGLLTVPGLRKINSAGYSDKGNKALDIIKKYVGKPDEIFDCQAELIDAGFEEYAKI